WINSEGYARLWTEIEDKLRVVKNQYDRKVNINQFPDDYYDLIDRIRIDITRRRIEEMDFTSIFTIEQTNPNFPKSIPLNQFLPFAGAFEEIKGTGDNVPMLQQKTGATRAVPVTLYGLGHARSLEDELYNLDIFSLEKVNAAVARAHRALRNDICFGPLIALTTAAGWDASQLVPADTTGATYDQRLYLTIRNAIRTLYGLLDPQTRQEINANAITLLVRNKVIEWDLSRILLGQLQTFGGRGDVENRERLPVNEVWKYKGDIFDVGPRRHEYPGVPEGTAYLFVTGPNGAPTWTLNKRQLTQEIGRGDVLQLARERRAWYCGQAEYREEFLGSSSDDIGAGLGSGFGYVVAIDLPEFDET
ncbi:MAG: hypothetical protein PVF17_12145, partial [Ignavibacteria bacterium]